MENLAVTDIGVGSSTESLTRDDERNRTVCCSSPTLGLGALRLSDDVASSLEEQFPNPRTIEGGGLLARRSRRAGRKFPGFLTISNEEEEDNPGTNSSPKTQEISTSPSSSCLENRSQTELCSSSPSSVLAYGNNTVPVEIVPCLFLGCARDAASRETLSKYDITYILNVTPNLPNVFENDKKYHYKQIAISDHWSQNLSQFFPEAIAFIDEAQSENCGILVHCLAGISRSVTVTVAYLMQKNLWSLNDAYDFVKQRKSNVSPNFNFMGQLLDFEKTLAINRDAADSGISSSCSSNSPPTLFFTSPPPPTSSPIPAVTEEGAALSCSTGQGQTHQKHRGMFCLSTIM